MPRLTHLAGLELGTGVNLCIVAPEQAAAELRDAVRALVQRVSRAVGDGRRRRSRARSAPGLLVLLGVTHDRHARPTPTGSPTRSARCASSPTPTAA